jgi:hypothetical protein
MTPRPEMLASLIGLGITGFVSGNCDVLVSHPFDTQGGNRYKIRILDAEHFALDDSCDEIVILMRTLLRNLHIE